MSASNWERVGKGLELLRDGLVPFVEQELKAEFGKEKWLMEARQVLRDENDLKVVKGKPRWEVLVLLMVMWEHWHTVFKKTLGHVERSLVSELRTVRNDWAHQQAFTTDDAYRAYDSMHRLLKAVSAPQAAEIDRMRQELLRVRFDEMAKGKVKRAASTATIGTPTAGLKPWREVIMPHPDVASGRYAVAEFMADLEVVHQEPERTEPEYADPGEFFRRTYVTEGLGQLLRTALRRLAGENGDPVVQLQTNFGGGKTHSLLALYHLFSGVDPAKLMGVEDILQEEKISTLPKVHRAVLVGTAMTPGASWKKPDGTEIHTIWGEMAWQLGQAAGDAKAAYTMVADNDQNGTNPGNRLLRELFSRYSPCLILIDEWVAYARVLYNKYDLPGGSFDTQFTFAQALTEAVSTSPGTLLVLSVPASDIEKGGEAGDEATTRLKNVVGRVESSWRPASAVEGFEIVRRRLFQSIDDPEKWKERDAVASAFATMYRDQSRDFPSEVSEGVYIDRMKGAYPIHPELFDRLYDDWSTLDRFQRTRGVLRLMAAIIHELWEREDRNLLILPGTIPMDAARVREELTRYLEEPWKPIMESDVDGPSALPLQIDRDNPALGKYSACRRVSRTIYMGSAPTASTAHPGVDELHIKLGTLQPGESVATFGDALRRLTDQATHLYVDGKRYWYSLQPSLTRTAKDRAAQIDEHDVWEEIKRRVRAQRGKGDFCGVHFMPESSSDVVDEMEARLVILGPEHPFASKDEAAPAIQRAVEIFEQRGNSPRLYRNMLVFAAPDRTRLAELEQATRSCLAWSSIVADRERLELTPFMLNQAQTKRRDSDEAVNTRIPETYSWLLVPAQPDPQGAIEWERKNIRGLDDIAVKASRKLRNDGSLITGYSATSLRIELDRRNLWKDVPHLGVKKLWEYMATYLYLPRLKDSQVLLEAIQDGCALLTWAENFAYAESWDEAKQKYLGLRGGQAGAVHMDDHSVIVKPDVAQRQMEAERPPEGDKPSVEPAEPGEPGAGPTTTTDEPATRTLSKRFFGSVQLDALRISRDVGDISQEVIQHINSLVGAEVEINLEISAKIPEGVPENVERTVTENCRTLRFTGFGFEKE